MLVKLREDLVLSNRKPDTLDVVLLDLYFGLD